MKKNNRMCPHLEGYLHMDGHNGEKEKNAWVQTCCPLSRGEGRLELWGDGPGFNCFKGRRLWDSHVPTWQEVLFCRLQTVLWPACFYLSMLNHHPSTRTGCLYLAHSVPKVALAIWIPSAPLWCLTSPWPAPRFWTHGPGEPPPSTAPLSLPNPS